MCSIAFIYSLKKKGVATLIKELNAARGETFSPRLGILI
jgi:hypothetical protein